MNTLSEPAQGSGVKMMAKDIRYLKTNLPLKPAAETLPAIFWIIGFLLPPLVIGVFWGWQRHQDKLVADPRYARKLTATRNARQSLKMARHARLHRDTKAFYSALAQALVNYLADQLGLSRSGITQREILHHLQIMKADEKLMTELTDLFDETDFARFAPSEREAAEMAEHEQQAEQVLTRLTRLLNKEKN